MRRWLSISLAVVLAAALVGAAYTFSRSTRANLSRPPTSGVISGRVLDPDGLPVPRARAYALSDRGSLGRIPTSITDEHGMFSIQGLEPGVYKVHAEKEEDNYAPTDNLFYSAGVIEMPQVTIADGQTSHDVTVRLGPRYTRVEGRIVDAVRNRPIKNLQDVQLMLRREDNSPYTYATAPDVEGNFSVLIPQVPFTIEVSAPSYERKRVHSTGIMMDVNKRVDILLHPREKGQ